MCFKNVRLIFIFAVFLLLNGNTFAEDAVAPDLTGSSVQELPTSVQPAVEEQPTGEEQPVVPDGDLTAVSPSDEGALSAGTDSLAVTASEAGAEGEVKSLSRRVEQSQPDVTNNGSLSYRYPIDVPAFRGLEPKLSLTYNSSRKTKTGGDYQGWLGYGWGLSGVPVIERAGYQQGVPHYTDDDIYLLNGEPLVKCGTPGVSGGASCGAGGNWVSEVENYLRIKFDGSDSANPVWEVTARDGTKTTFTTVGKIPGAAATVPGDKNDDVRLRYRWLATSVADTFGNTVSYSYACPELPVCYPTRIAYYNKGSSSSYRSIEFYREERPDFITSGNGHSLSTINRRIKTVLVKTAGIKTWGYKLSYDEAPLSGSSRLLSVQQFGSDLEMDAEETIIAMEGSALPATSFSYNNANAKGFRSGKDVAGVTGAPYLQATFSRQLNDQGPIKYEWKSISSTEISAMDVNSDGVTEIIQKKYNTDGCTYRLVSSGSGGEADSALNLNGAKCASIVVNGDPFERGGLRTGLPLIPGHFGSDKKQTQLLAIDDSNNTRPVRWQMTLTKNGRQFAAKINDCQADSGSSNSVTDAYLKPLCDNSFPKLNPLDKKGEGRDFLTEGAYRKGNFFGDGREQIHSWSGADDLLLYSQNGESKELNLGETFCRSGCIYLDLNGDGLDDLIVLDAVVADEKWQTVFTSYLFTGDRFVVWTAKNGMSPQAYVASTFISDVDGDGRAELGLGITGGSISDFKYPSGEPRIYYPGYTWSIFGAKHSQSERGFFEKVSLGISSSFTTAGDFDGDGQTDLLTAPVPALPTDAKYESNAEYLREVLKFYDETRLYHIWYGSASNGTSSSGGIANLLNTVTTSQGGQVKAVYTPSTAYENTYLPYSMPTVSALSILDGRGQTATTKYSYAGGDYNIDKRRFLGFGTVTKTLPSSEANAPVVKTTYKQTLATIGLPSKTEYLDGVGVVGRSVAETYATNTTTLPYTAENTATVTAISVGAVTRTLRTEREFDEYGNITQVQDYGRTDVLEGDEVLSQYFFDANPSAYIVSKLRLSRTFKGTEAVSNQRVSQQQFIYDGNAYGAPPEQGFLTSRLDFTTSTSSQTTAFTKDTYGNVATSTRILDPANTAKDEKTTYTYDSTHHLFVTKTVYPNGLTETATPNAACSGPATQTDFNGIVTAHSYDVFCRPTEVVNQETGSMKTTAYLDFGDPGAQRIKTSTSLPNGTATADQYEYFDGLGRTWRSLTIGDGSSPTTRVDTEYDLRGNAAKVSLPYIADATIYSTITTFDWANRPIKIANPDNSYKSIVYGLYNNPDPDIVKISVSDNIPLEYTRVTDEKDYLNRYTYTYTYTSTAGDVIAKYQKSVTTDGSSMSRWIHGATFDAAHRMISAKDTSGAVWTYTYDLMGNRTKAQDPDLGTWDYVYDNANRLIRQTDARGKVTTISYDKNGRPLRTLGYETVAAADADTDREGGILLSQNTYDEARTGYFNKGQLTTSYNELSGQEFDRQEFGYSADGLQRLKQVTLTDNLLPGGSLVHVEKAGYDQGRQPIWKYYGAGQALTIGSSADPWVYNRKGQLLSVPGYITATTYEPDGQTATITYDNGVTTTFTYSPTRRWLLKFVTQKGATIIADGTYTRDDTGRIESINATGTNNDWEYTYDGFGRIQKTEYAGDANSGYSESFTYANNDNLLTRSRLAGSFVYPAATAALPHAPLSLNGLNFTYDDNGNTLTIGKNTETTADDRVFTYDVANRVYSVKTATSATLNVRYGPDGARAKKSSIDTGSTFYIDANVEYNPTTATFTRYPHMDVKVVGVLGSDKSGQYFLHRDHLSSVRAVTSASGAIAESTRYVVYGESQNKTMTTQKNYIGERFDPESGLIYLNARYMDPKFGRFISPDTWDPTMQSAQDGMTTAVPSSSVEGIESTSP